MRVGRSSCLTHPSTTTTTQLFDGGDARFGIDRTAKEYKETEGMKQILGEQAKRRRTGDSKDRAAASAYVAPAEAAAASSAVGREKGETKKGGGGGGAGKEGKKSLASLAQKFAKRK